ncbi:MAG: GTP pyrophosphokinase [Bacilli bacterium]|nr:GTP pyrophosphokinase [Bacilli bacterium]
MIYTSDVKKALNLMYNSHIKQYDKSGVPYVFHPFHVAEQMDDEDSTIVALLHDIIEDTDVTIEDLVSLGFSVQVINALKCLTHLEDEDYFDYIKRVSNNEIAKKVKIQDLKHNMDLSRLSSVSEKDLQRVEKYKKSLKFLLDSYEDNIGKSI